MTYRVGSQFKLSPNALKNYGEQYRDKIFTVRAKYTHSVPVARMQSDPTGHPGFDPAGGSPLYGSELNFDLSYWLFLARPPQRKMHVPNPWN